LPAVLPIPLAIPKKRLALARMYIDLTSAFHASVFPPDQTPVEIDANLVLVAVAVMLGHAGGHPMTSSGNCILRANAPLVCRPQARRTDRARHDSTHRRQVLSGTEARGPVCPISTGSSWFCRRVSPSRCPSVQTGHLIFRSRKGLLDTTYWLQLLPFLIHRRNQGNYLRTVAVRRLSRALSF